MGEPGQDREDILPGHDRVIKGAVDKGFGNVQLSRIAGTGQYTAGTGQLV
jgi:hypothetical protein